MLLLLMGALVFNGLGLVLLGSAWLMAWVINGTARLAGAMSTAAWKISIKREHYYYNLMLLLVAGITTDHTHKHTVAAIVL